MSEDRPQYTTTPTINVPIVIVEDTLEARAVKLMRRAKSEGRPFLMMFEGDTVRAFYLDKGGMVRS